MFDVSFSELIVIGIVALVVIGPERLPKVARTAGHLMGRLQRYVNDVKSDISREMQLDELKKLKAEMQDSASSFEQSIKSEFQSIEQTVEQTAQSAQTGIQELSAAPATANAEVAAVVPGAAGQPSGPAVSADKA